MILKLQESARRLFASYQDFQFSVAGLLTTLWLVAGLAWYLACRSIETPRIFGDELNYWNMARSFHQGANVPYWSVNYDIPTHLFSRFLAPIFGLPSLIHAYQAARLLTPFLTVTVVFPAYLLSRELLERRYALAVALLSVALPGVAYSSTLMTENLFYPLFVTSVWAAYRALASGRLRDGLIAGAVFVATYYAKPHVLVLVVAYTFCVLFWFCASLKAPHDDLRKSISGFLFRLVPLALLCLALIPRFFALPADDHGISAILFGKGYQRLLQGSNAYALSQAFAAWNGLLLSSLIATLFVPFALFVASGFQLKSMEPRRRWFWLLTALSWLGYTVLSARHTVLNDGSIRVHERYIFMIFPQFFVWYFLVREEKSRRFTAIATLIAIAVGAAIMRWPAHVFLTPHINTDSPSLTAFLCVAWIYRLSFLQLAVLVAALGCAALIFSFSRRPSRSVVAWTVILVLLTFGWVHFENRWINPLHVRLRNLALSISSQVGPGATVGVLVESKNWLPRFYLDFWMEQPTILYGIDPHSQVPGSFNWNSPYVRPVYLGAGGTPDFGTPAPDYLLSNINLSQPLPLAATFPNANETLYLYRIPKAGNR